MNDKDEVEARRELSSVATLILAEHDRAVLYGRQDALVHVHDAAIEVLRAMVEYLGALQKSAAATEKAEEVSP